MATLSPAPQVIEGNSKIVATDLTRGRSPSASSAILNLGTSDDNPRSPKRRRLSPVGDAQKPGETVQVQVPPVTSEPQRTGPPKVQQTQPTTISSAKPENKVNNVATTQNSSQSPAVAARLENLPVLDERAHQILALLARLTPAEALGLARIPDAPSTREYTALRSQFEYTRRFYNTGAHFLSPKDLGMRENSQIEILRKANLAIFISSVFTGEIGLRDMDRSFLSVFVPEGGKLLKPQGSMYLELKTQGFITAWRTGAAPPAVVMADMFGPDLDKSILSRRPGATTLALSEQDFLSRLSSRREILQTHIKNNTLSQLPDIYKWEDFSRDVSTYLSKNIENSSTNQNLSAEPPRNAARMPQQGQMEGQFSVHPSSVLTGSRELPLSAASASQSKTSSVSLLDDDFVAQAARAAEIAMQASSGLPFAEQLATLSSTPPPLQTTTQGSEAPSADYQQYDPTTERAISHTLAQDVTPVSGEIPHASQTAPTSVLYERARLAATTKALAVRKGVTPSQRRPWTTEEENTLMAGLDRVKGPHWSQILAMYGPGGTVNEALKDRNQVQLKDKARNLKLFFLKSGIEVPYYLKYVTGDLKTRAPGHPNKQEARDQENGQGFMGLDDADQEALATGSSGSRSGQQSPTAEDFEESNVQTEDKKPFEPSMDEVEAMIARAAAQVSQSLDAKWP